MRRVHTVLRDLGHEITEDWTKYAGPDAPEISRRQAADQDVLGVLNADLVIVLTEESKELGCGMWAEQGMAAVLGIRLITVGPLRDRNVFCEYAMQIESDEHIPEAIDNASRAVAAYKLFRFGDRLHLRALYG